MFMLGLSPFIGILYATVIAFLVYFGIKVFVGRRKQSILNATGNGLCADCGTKLEQDSCPNCSNPKP